MRYVRPCVHANRFLSTIFVFYSHSTTINQEPLNSGDDVSDEDPTELFDTDNVVVCQYDKVS